MKKIYLDFLVSTKEEKGLSYESISARTNMSISKLQRIFTGQTDPTVSDFEHVVEAGLQADVSKVYAQIGAQEFRDSKEVDYKGAKELLHDFSAEKEQIRQEYELRITQSIQARLEMQKSFDAALQQMKAQYKENAAYLTRRTEQAEEQAVDLAARAARAEEIAQAAQKRAETAEIRADTAEDRREQIDKRRHHVFWCMVTLLAMTLTFLLIIIIADVPQLGGGNV